MTDQQTPLIRWMARQLVQNQIEIAALRMALKEKGVLTAFDLDRHLVHLRKEMKPLLAQLDVSAPETLLESLRKLEGPA